MSAPKTQLLVRSVQLIDIDGRTTIPTCVLSDGKRVLIGHEALEAAADDAAIRDDFKVDLGKHDPATHVTRSASRQANVQRSPLGLTKDFFECAIRAVEEWIATRKSVFPNHIVVAEPLSMEDNTGFTNAWLSNYRACIKRIIPKQMEVDFIPEPFAVFQYYRYGVRHPLLAQKQKHIALVIDFGGGTFDVCVIETTREGDIREGGKNSRPISARSIPVGGFYINRMIAEHLLFANIAKDSNKSILRKAIEKFYEAKESSDLRSGSYTSEHKNFFRHFSLLLKEVEIAKINVCSQIHDWDLASDLVNVPKHPVNVPLNPFSQKPQYNIARLDAGTLRQIFEDRIWKQRLREAINTCIQRASRHLQGQLISVVLLSGGSANIRWLKVLLENYIEPLKEAALIELHENFQEVVAKGLAIECARRFYSDDGGGDFKAVTYNQLCVAVRSDGDKLEVRSFKPATTGLPTGLAEGVLVDSATNLTGLIDVPLTWKFRMSKPPSRYLDYFFMRNSFDPEDLANVQNIDHRVHTPSGTRFGSRLQLELKIREDGTTFPGFVYSSDQQNVSVCSAEGKPFYLDMTFGSQATKAVHTYLGFDFGSSNSSVSIVSAKDVSVFADRELDRSWLQLNDLVAALPYPAAAPLARFMAESNRSGLGAVHGRGTIEGILCIAAYVAYAEWCTVVGPGKSHHLKGMAHRSAGPLWSLLNRSLESLGDQAHFARGFRAFLTDDLRTMFAQLIADINNDKHEMASDIDYPRVIHIIGNILVSALKPFIFGSFESVMRKSLYGGFAGIFRAINGSGSPFINLFDYFGRGSFSDEELYLVDNERGCALLLSPLMIRYVDVDRRHLDDSDIVLYDKLSDDVVIFKAVRMRKALEFHPDGVHAELNRAVRQMKLADQSMGLVQGVKVRRISQSLEND